MKPLLPDITVNGETIPAAEIAAEAQNHPAPKAKPGLAWRAAARALAVRALLLQEARRRGLTPAPQEVAPGRRETGAEALVRQVLEEAVIAAPPSEAELRAIHAARPDRFRAPALYEAAHILIPAPPGGDDAEARAKADAVLEELRANPKAFDRLARAHSACSSKANGGRLGQITAGDTVAEFEAALATMQEGEIAPVRTRYGLHVVRLDARATGAALPFEAVAAPLRLATEKTAWTRAARAFVAGLAARAEVTGVSLAAGEAARRDQAEGKAEALDTITSLPERSFVIK